MTRGDGGNAVPPRFSSDVARPQSASRGAVPRRCFQSARRPREPCLPVDAVPVSALRRGDMPGRLLRSGWTSGSS